MRPEGSDQLDYLYYGPSYYPKDGVEKSVDWGKTDARKKGHANDDNNGIAQAQDGMTRAGYEQSIARLRDNVEHARQHRNAVRKQVDFRAHWFANSKAQEAHLQRSTAHLKESAKYMRSLAENAAKKIADYRGELTPLAEKANDALRSPEALEAMIHEQVKDNVKRQMEPWKKIHSLQSEISGELLERGLASDKERHQKSNHDVNSSSHPYL